MQQPTCSSLQQLRQARRLAVAEEQQLCARAPAALHTGSVATARGERVQDHTRSAPAHHKALNMQLSRVPRAASARPGACPASRAVAARAVKLYTNPASRGRIVEWYVQELGLQGVEVINVDLQDKHSTPEFVKVNPFRKVPALSDGDLCLFESGALLTYLADKYGGLDTPEARAKACQWVLFANSTLFDAVFVDAWREKAMPDVFGRLDALLAGRDFLEGEGAGAFSVSDVAVGSYLLYVPAFFPQLDLSPWPNVVAYMQRLAARPACVVPGHASAPAG